MTDFPGTIGSDRFTGTIQNDLFTTGGGGTDVFTDELGGDDVYRLDRAPGNLYATGRVNITDLDSDRDTLVFNDFVPDRADQLNVSVRATGDGLEDLEISFGPDRQIILQDVLGPNSVSGPDVLAYAGRTANVRALDKVEEFEGAIKNLLSGSNRAPVILGSVPPITMVEDGDPQTVDLRQVLQDQDGDNVTYTVKTQPASGTATIDADGVLTFIALPNDNGSRSVRVTANDGRGGSTDLTIPITITPVNDAPIVSSPVLNLEPGDSQQIRVTARDVDGPSGLIDLQAPLTVVTNDLGTLTLVSSRTNTADYTFVANEGVSGSETIDIQFRDGEGAIGTGTLTINVDQPNTAPDTSAVIRLDLNEDDPTQSLNLQNLVPDAEGNFLDFALKRGTNLGEALLDDEGNFTFTPEANAFGVDTVTYSAFDGELSSDGEIAIQIASVNDAPTVDSVPVITTDEDSRTQTIQLRDFVSDIDNDSLTYSSTDTTTLGEFSVSENGNVSFTPAENANGDDTLTFSVTDGTATTDGEIGIQVLPVNDTPVVDGTGTISAIEGGSAVTLDLSTLVSDPDGDTLSFSSTDNSELGGFDVTEAGLATFTPTEFGDGSDRLSFSATDGESSVDGNVDVTVTPNPALVDPPVFARDDFFSTQKEKKFFDKGFKINLKKLAKNDVATESKIDKKSVEIDEASVTGGTLEIRGKKAIFTADEGETTGTFEYTVFDKEGLESPPATVTIDGPA